MITVMSEKELNNTIEFLALRDRSSKTGHEFSGAKQVRVDSEGRLWLDFGNAAEAPVQSIPKSVNSFSAINNAFGIAYLPLEGAVSVAAVASVHTVKSLMPRKYKIIGIKVNARIATIGAGESVDIHVMDNTTASTITVTLDDTYVADAIEAMTGSYDMTTDYLAIRVDPTNLVGASVIDNIHVGIELVPLEE